jgi:ABC-type multidrug transport system ATPase subunit
VRDDLVRAVLELAGEERWTVVISSHDLDEVERLVDVVGFLDGGRLVLNESFADLHGRFRRIDVTTGQWPGPIQVPESWISVQTAGRVVASSKVVTSKLRPSATLRRWHLTLSWTCNR